MDSVHPVRIYLDLFFFSTGSNRYAAHHTIHHINYYNSYNVVLNQERYHGGIIPIC